jgi:hypothetical protein
VVCPPQKGQLEFHPHIEQYASRRPPIPPQNMKSIAVQVSPSIDAERYLKGRLLSESMGSPKKQSPPTSQALIHISRGLSGRPVVSGRIGLPNRVGKRSRREHESGRRTWITAVGQFINWKRSEGRVGELWLNRMRWELLRIPTLLRRISPDATTPTPSSLLPDDIRALRRGLPWERATWGVHLSALRQFLRWTENPCRRLEGLRKSWFASKGSTVCDAWRCFGFVRRTCCSMKGHFESSERGDLEVSGELFQCIPRRAELWKTG